MTAAISVRQLAVVFRGGFRQPPLTALHPLDLDVAPGAVVGVLGPNGSGKTTLLRVLAGVQRPTSGSVSVLGLAPHAPDAVRRVGYQPEGALPLGVLSAREFLQFVGCQLRLADAEADARVDRWLERLGLAHTGRRQVRTFSTGMQKRLALAAALLGDPAVLLLDEPTAGIDPAGSALVLELLRERARAGTAVLMASHHLQEVEEACDEVLVLHDGAVRARGRLDALLGTGEQALVVRGLDAAGLAQLAAAAHGLGGEVLRTEQPRRHLFALFRDLLRAPERT